MNNAKFSVFLIFTYPAFLCSVFETQEHIPLFLELESSFQVLLKNDRLNIDHCVCIFKITIFISAVGGENCHFRKNKTN